MSYFCDPKTRERLSDILLVYAKMNPDVLYRQGMHELLAMLLWVVEHDAMEEGEEGDDEMRLVLDKAYVEHDTFTLFCSLMASAKQWYEFHEERKIPKVRQSSFEIHLREAPSAPTLPILRRTAKIHHEYLQAIDRDLYRHLEDEGIEPQIYTIRWLRLLFGREFPFQQVLQLWDGLFAESAALNLVDFMCIAMLLFMRDDLLELDYADCLSRLMRFPKVENVLYFVRQAVLLRDHTTSEAGRQVLYENAELRGTVEEFLAKEKERQVVEERNVQTSATPPIAEFMRVGVAVGAKAFEGLKRAGAGLAASRPSLHGRSTSDTTKPLTVLSPASVSATLSAPHDDKVEQQMAQSLSRALLVLERELLAHNLNKAKMNEHLITAALTSVRNVRDVLSHAVVDFEPSILDTDEEWEVVASDLGKTSSLASRSEVAESIGSGYMDTVMENDDVQLPVRSVEKPVEVEKSKEVEAVKEAEKEVEKPKEVPKPEKTVELPEPKPEQPKPKPVPVETAYSKRNKRTTRKQVNIHDLLNEIDGGGVSEPLASTPTTTSLTTRREPRKSTTVNDLVSEFGVSKPKATGHDWLFGDAPSPRLPKTPRARTVSTTSDKKEELFAGLRARGATSSRVDPLGAEETPKKTVDKPVEVPVVDEPLPQPEQVKQQAEETVPKVVEATKPSTSTPLGPVEVAKPARTMRRAPKKNANVSAAALMLEVDDWETREKERQEQLEELEAAKHQRRTPLDQIGKPEQPPVNDVWTNGNGEWEADQPAAEIASAITAAVEDDGWILTEKKPKVEMKMAPPKQELVVDDAWANHTDEPKPALNKPAVTMNVSDDAAAWQDVHFDDNHEPEPEPSSLSTYDPSPIAELADFASSPIEPARSLSNSDLASPSLSNRILSSSWQFSTFSKARNKDVELDGIGLTTKAVWGDDQTSTSNPWG